MLDLRQVECRYEEAPVLESLSFHIDEGDICCLLGPSGCGKTTALRAIAGFQRVSAGEILLDGAVLSSPTVQVPPEQRRVGMVFQDYALFPHLSVFDNIAFGLRKLPAARQRRIVGALLDLVRLESVEARYPHELSGGQQQRVALARAMATGPRLLLLDEPFSNLDVELRRKLNLEVRDILKQYGISAILVTHDQDEAFAFGDRIGLLHQGRLQQWDTAFNLYHEPSNRFVADFIGQGCFLPGTLSGPHTVLTELGEIHGQRTYTWPLETPVEVLLRPDDVTLDERGIPAQVVKKVFSGSATLYTLRLPTGSLVEALLPSHHDYLVEDTVCIRAGVEHLIAFRRGEGTENRAYNKSTAL